MHYVKTATVRASVSATRNWNQLIMQVEMVVFKHLARSHSIVRTRTCGGAIVKLALATSGASRPFGMQTSS
jgi:hypothetical protein